MNFLSIKNNTNPQNVIYPSNWNIKNIRVLYNGGEYGYIFAVVESNGKDMYVSRYDNPDVGRGQGYPNCQAGRGKGLNPCWFIEPNFVGEATINMLIATYRSGFDREHINPDIEKIKHYIKLN